MDLQQKNKKILINNKIYAKIKKIKHYGAFFMWTYNELKFKARGVLISCFTKSLLVVLIYNLITNLPALILPMNSAVDIPRMTEEDFIKIETAIMNNVEFVISIVLGIILVILLCSVFIVSPLKVGKKRFFNRAIEGEVSIKNLFFPFMSGAREYFGVLKVTFMKSFFVVLWSMVGFIPFFGCVYVYGNFYVSLIFLLLGVVLLVFKNYQYFMVDYIVADNSDIKWREALKQSKTMMNKKIFYVLGLTLSFIGWYLLGTFFGPIGTILVVPYIELTFSVLYFALKGEYLQEIAKKEQKSA